MKNDRSLSMLKANIFSILYSIPIILIMSFVFILMWDWEHFKKIYFAFSGSKLTLTLILIVGIIIHEFLHGVGWKISSWNRKFSIHIKSFTPYAHCKEKMNVNHYRIGVVLPFLVLGVIPTVVSLINGNLQLLFIGLFFILIAGGDLMILGQTMNLGSDVEIEDHPTRAGFYVHNK